MDFPASVQYLYSLGNEVKSIKLGLERIQTVLERLGNPERHCPIVHVAGTNGKGSVCAMIDSTFRHAGYRTGFYTSPHLVSPTERIRIDGEPVSEAEFARAFAVVHEASEGLDCHPTYFETVTAMAFVLFRDANVDRVVLEVGLGGRLDATNVVDPELSVITPVDMDHQQYLGDTLEAIAREKAGIIKPGRPVVLGLQHAEVKHVFVSEQLEDVATWSVTGLELRPDGCSYRASKGEVKMTIRCGLAGAHQVGNSLTAAVALHRLGMDVQVIEEGIAKASWPGRLEIIRREPLMYLDGAHNIAAAKRLREFIERHFKGREVWMVFGVMRDKDVREITEELFPAASRLIVTAVAQQRALEPEAIAEMAGRGDVVVTHSVREALEALKNAPKDAVIFITGSLFVVGEARPLLQ
jgi:dihydrofolate synthase / folylpolyglutamate synthase